VNDSSLFGHFCGKSIEKIRAYLDEWRCRFCDGMEDGRRYAHRAYQSWLSTSRRVYLAT
jgi:hypothetical protein